ncbi:MAG: 1,2-phenylacetyl-CoA epoxidase subunit A, partial [Gemmatimonadaceae bacterium]
MEKTPQPTQVDSARAASAHDASNERALEAAFDARIAAGESIEPKDWMPERYRRQLTRMMSQHAHSEI